MDLSAVQLYNNEQEEEERRRAALLGLGMIDFVGEGQSGAGTVPMVQGNPQLGGVPSVQGTPPFFAQQAGQAASTLSSAPTWSAPQYAPPAYPQPAPIRPSLPHQFLKRFANFYPEQGVVQPAFRFIHIEFRRHHIKIAGQNNWYFLRKELSRMSRKSLKPV